jgi:opacity protein-like surface antigen
VQVERDHLLMKTDKRFKTYERRTACHYATRLALGALAALLIAACGTTSELRTTQGSASASSRKFTKVTVQDFKLALTEAEENSPNAPKYFADRIATELRATARFSKVSRNAPADANTLVVTGTITKYHEGNSMLRLFVGMGAGSAFFEADIYFRDNKGVSVGQIKADKNSWALGGGVAAAQNPTMFMNGAAEKIAQEAAKLAR